MHVENYSLRTLADRDRRKYWYRMATWIIYALLCFFLALELHLTGLLTLTPRDDGLGYKAAFSTFVGLAILGTCAVAWFITWVRNSSNLYFSSKIQSCSKTECVLWWFACTLVWVIAIGFFWTDWVLAAKVHLYSGYALTAGANHTIGEEHISLN